MASIEELEHRLDDAVREVRADREHRIRARNVAHNKASELSELRDVISGTYSEREHQQERCKLIRHELDAIMEDGVSEAERHRRRVLSDRLEHLVDENEDLTATIREALPKAHDLAEGREDAAEMFKHFSAELRLAVARREKIQKELRKAHEAEQNSVLGTPYFVVAEFDCHDGTPVPVASIPALRANVQSYLVPLREAHGLVHVNSGYRTLRYNQSIGGASMSVHVYDGPWQKPDWACAVDHWNAQLNPREVQNWHEVNTHPDGMGRYTSFTHVDNRNRLGWADSRWDGP